MMAAGWPKVAGSTLAPRIGYIQGDAERLSCPDACFDAAMVGFGIRNLTRPEVGFQGDVPGPEAGGDHDVPGVLQAQDRLVPPAL